MVTLSSMRMMTMTTTSQVLQVCHAPMLQCTWAIIVFSFQETLALFLATDAAGRMATCAPGACMPAPPTIQHPPNTWAQTNRPKLEAHRPHRVRRADALVWQRYLQLHRIVSTNPNQGAGLAGMRSAKQRTMMLLHHEFGVNHHVICQLYDKVLAYVCLGWVVRAGC
jgi:hypothetical protein